MYKLLDILILKWWLKVYVIIRLILIYFNFMFYSLSLLNISNNVGTPQFYVYLKSDFFVWVVGLFGHAGIGHLFQLWFRNKLISGSGKSHFSLMRFQDCWIILSRKIGISLLFFLGFGDLTPSSHQHLCCPCFILFSCFIMLESYLRVLIDFKFYCGPFGTPHNMFSSC